MNETQRRRALADVKEFFCAPGRWPHCCWCCSASCSGWRSSRTTRCTRTSSPATCCSTTGCRAALQRGGGRLYTG
ncbi:hypothetical protein NIA69_22970 [Gemmiger formicilis]|nr:hypothetical protein [Gemmiger formicilis]